MCEIKKMRDLQNLIISTPNRLVEKFLCLLICKLWSQKVKTLYLLASCQLHIPWDPTLYQWLQTGISCSWSYLLLTAFRTQFFYSHCTAKLPEHSIWTLNSSSSSDTYLSTALTSAPEFMSSEIHEAIASSFFNTLEVQHVIRGVVGPKHRVK